jgi:DNA gyrase subunit A
MESETTQNDRILGVDIAETMQKSFIDYAMSVIVARALPDARDGLKPVHRRILHAMNELNLDPTKAHKKSARIVGDTMGKYHPHGDLAIYDAMVRMAQPFSLRYPLVDGHGNFGSMDGDGAAAQRYTEARLSRLAMELLDGIEQDTVDFAPNYDGEFSEPTVFPARFPSLLVNGSSGIAVGMATNIPPHNLTDAVSAVVRMLDDRLEGKDTDIEELINIIKAPDYPTGGAILGTAGVREAYRTGRGRVVLRAVAEIQPMQGGGREMIVVTEVPYQVNKARLVAHMAELVKDKKIDGITDIRDESNRNGVRIVVELRKDANANVVLNQLYKFSSLQESFGIIMLALADGQPRVLDLKELCECYIDHQKEVVTRRTRFELNKAKKRAHILEGYLKALDHIDEVIAIIRSSADTPAARARRIDRFEFSEEQAAAIVDMRLRALTGLERERLQSEYNELRIQIEELTAILDDERRLYRVIKEELLIVQTKYGDARKTAILHDEGEILTEDLIDEAESVVTLSHLNYIKRIPLDTYRSQNRGGKGVIGMQTREEDLVKDLFVANTHDYILFFTDHGRVYRLKAYEIPEAGRTARGVALVNLLQLGGGESVAAVIPVGKGTPDDHFLTMVTRGGIIKKTEISHFSNIKRSGIIALNIREDDALIAVLRSDGKQSLFLAARSGRGIRFPETDVRPMGRAASGVTAMRLNAGDCIVGADIVDADANMLFVSVNGLGKCTQVSAFKVQRRGGKGLTVYKTSEKTGALAGVASVGERDELMLINSEGVIIRMRVADISVQGRVTQGVRLIKLKPGVGVVGIAKISEEIIKNDDMNE